MTLNRKLSCSWVKVSKNGYPTLLTASSPNIINVT